MKTIPSALACLALLAAAGCGGGAEEPRAPTERTNEATLPTSSKAGPSTSPADVPGGGNVIVVDMRDIEYVPENVSVKVGQTVRWTNNDAVAHTVTADRGASFDSGTINAGKKYEWKAAKAGSVHYYCTIHGQQQSGTIKVTGG
jgi:plastocyanin